LGNVGHSQSLCCVEVGALIRVSSLFAFQPKVGFVTALS
jgi:hypothetical protein